LRNSKYYSGKIVIFTKKTVGLKNGKLLQKKKVPVYGNEESMRLNRKVN